MRCVRPGVVLFRRRPMQQRTTGGATNLATLNDEFDSPDPRSGGWVTLSSSQFDGKLPLSKVRKEVPTGTEVDISRLTPEERIELVAFDCEGTPAD